MARPASRADHVAQADAQGFGLREHAAPHRLFQFVAEAEDLVGIAQHRLAGLGQRQPTSLLAQQFLAKLVFQHLQLGADRLWGHVQLLRGARDAAHRRDGMKILQVLVIDHLIPPKNGMISKDYSILLSFCSAVY
jgi:hypothetical protein